MAVAACTPPATEAAPPPPAVPTAAPQAGRCYVLVTQASHPVSDVPVDCARGHRAETVAVGTFGASRPADAASPPFGTPGMAEAFGFCDAQATEFVGGEWRNGRLSLIAVMPEPALWAAGARWYRCDLFEVADISTTVTSWQPGEDVRERTGSLRGALKEPGSALAHTCFRREGEKAVAVACSAAHDVEFGGVREVLDVKQSRAQLMDADDGFDTLCAPLLAGFLGAGGDRKLITAVAGTFYAPTEAAWERGDRKVRCLLWTGGKMIKRSMRNAGREAYLRL